MTPRSASYQPKPGEERKGRVSLQVQCLFGTFELQRTYFHQPDKKLGHYPADVALGLEVGYTPGLARLMCLERYRMAIWRGWRPVVIRLAASLASSSASLRSSAAS